jgi:AcrR family transcriptional regulator
VTASGPDSPDSGRPWRGLSPVERRDGRRRRLLDAGLDLFGTDGYAATSLTALCAAGSVSPRHFYELFPGREQLLSEVYDELVAETVRRVSDAQQAAPLTVEAQVRAGLAAAVGWLTEDPRRARIVLLEISGVSPALDAHRREVIRGFAAVIDGGRARLAAAGLVRDRPFGQVSVGLVGAINELLVEWLLADPRPAPETVLPPLVDILAAVFP